MASRSTAAALNAILWGSGYLYSRRGINGVFAALAHLTVYGWSYLLGFDAWLLWAPILTLGTLYFGIDGYKHHTRPAAEVAEKSKMGRRMFCSSCGSQISVGVKFCPDCGAGQAKRGES